MVWRARISVKQKLGLAALFGCGLVTMAFGAARFVFILGSKTGDTGFAARWSSREQFFAIVIFNVPVLFPLICQKVAGYAQKSRRAGSDASRSGGLTAWGSPGTSTPTGGRTGPRSGSSRRPSPAGRATGRNPT